MKLLKLIQHEIWMAKGFAKKACLVFKENQRHYVWVIDTKALRHVSGMFRPDYTECSQPPLQDTKGQDQCKDSCLCADPTGTRILELWFSELRSPRPLWCAWHIVASLDFQTEISAICLCHLCLRPYAYSCMASSRPRGRSALQAQQHSDLDLHQWLGQEHPKTLKM